MSPRASSSAGNDISTSTMRISTWPRRGKSAENTPIGTPVRSAKLTTPTPISSAIREE